MFDNDERENIERKERLRNSSSERRDIPFFFSKLFFFLPSSGINGVNAREIKCIY
jgi:hypothetical protein